jgi:hypothetical protein
MTSARQSHASVLLDTGQVLIVGGAEVGLKSAELYDPASGIFKATGAMVSSRLFPIATALPNRKVLIVGGSSEAGVPDAELYFY